MLVLQKIENPATAKDAKDAKERPSRRVQPPCGYAAPAPVPSEVKNELLCVLCVLGGKWVYVPDNPKSISACARSLFFCTFALPVMPMFSNVSTIFT